MLQQISSLLCIQKVMKSLIAFGALGKDSLFQSLVMAIVSI